MAPPVGCTYNGDIPDGSIIASLIFNKALNSFASGFGTSFSNVVATTSQTSTNNIACIRLVDGTGAVASVDPSGPNQSQVQFAFLNNPGVNATTLYSTFSPAVANGAFGNSLATAMGNDNSYRNPTNLEAQPYSNDSSSGLSDGAIAGIVIGSVIGGILLIVLLLFFVRGRSTKTVSNKNRYDNRTNDNHDADAHIESHEVETDEVELA